MTIAVEEATYQLSEEEVSHFRKDGYLGPYEMCPPEEMNDMRDEVARILETDAPDHKVRGHNRHLDNRLIYDLSTHPAILDRMSCLYGPDLLMWRTNFFDKKPGAKEIPWHQDFNYWPLEPPIINSAWLAVDESTVENSCIQIVPGSHKKIIPHIHSTEGMQFGEMADPNYIDKSEAINLEMKPGEFILFNERTLHHSESNRSQKRRIGLAIRVIVPIVKVLSWDSPNHALQVIRGEDRIGNNSLVDPPTV